MKCVTLVLVLAIAMGEPLSAQTSDGIPSQTSDGCLVPNLIGLSRAAAIARLRQSMLAPGRIDTRASDQPSGTVIDQQPQQCGEPNGNRVNLVVSKAAAASSSTSDGRNGPSIGDIAVPVGIAVGAVVLGSILARRNRNNNAAATPDLAQPQAPAVASEPPPVVASPTAPPPPVATIPAAPPVEATPIAVTPAPAAALSSATAPLAPPVTTPTTTMPVAPPAPDTPVLNAVPARPPTPAAAPVRTSAAPVAVAVPGASNWRWPLFILLLLGLISVVERIRKRLSGSKEATQIPPPAARVTCVPRLDTGDQTVMPHDAQGAAGIDLVYQADAGAQQLWVEGESPRLEQIGA